MDLSLVAGSFTWNESLVALLNSTLKPHYKKCILHEHKFVIAKNSLWRYIPNTISIARLFFIYFLIINISLYRGISILTLFSCSLQFIVHCSSKLERLKWPQGFSLRLFVFVSFPCSHRVEASSLNENWIFQNGHPNFSYCGNGIDIFFEISHQIPHRKHPYMRCGKNFLSIGSARWNFVQTPPLSWPSWD